MRRISCVMLSALALLSLFASGAIASETVKEAVAAAASRGLPTMLQQIPSEETKHYGFKNSFEMSLAQVGEPMEIFTVHPDEMMFYSGKDFGAFLRSTGEWYVPVLVGSENRALLTVTWEDGAWQVVGISAAGLARELGAFKGNIQSMLDNEGVQQREQPRFVRIFQAYSDFMYVPTTREEYLVPFSSAQAALDFAPDKLLIPEMVVPLLKMEVSPN